MSDAQDPIKTFTGGCRCGAVRYEARTTRLRSAVCACPDCQRSSGAYLSVAVGFKAENFKITRGQAQLKSYADLGESGQPVHRSFCQVCGDPLFARPESYAELVSVRAVSLDEPVTTLPSFAIFGERIPAWLSLDAQIPHMDD